MTEVICRLFHGGGGCIHSWELFADRGGPPFELGATHRSAPAQSASIPVISVAAPPDLPRYYRIAASLPVRRGGRLTALR